VVNANWLAVEGLLVRLKVAVPLTPDVDAVTVYGPPAIVLAVKTDEVARPLELVVTSHSLAAGLPPAHEAKEPDGPEVGAVNVTDTPETGLPLESVTLATSGAPNALCTVSDCGEPEDSAMAAG
jgi:hypothetical protein